MSDLLAKLFSRGNRLSDRFYSDRARPDRDVKQFQRERRRLGSDSQSSTTPAEAMKKM
jgi:hypothetical protein